MQLRFVGAAREVTGSCYYLEVCGKKILIDCGMRQGLEESDDALPFAPSGIDYVFLTHAHIDHSGRLPLLAKLGFRGQVFATGATCQLCDIMLRDSAHIQEFEAEWKNRKGKRAGKEVFEPLYTMNDAQAVLNNFVPVEYRQKVEVCEGIFIRFVDVGHLLGSASVEVWMEENGVSKKIVFSGDIGNLNQPLIKNPATIDDADYVVMESTYGDRSHKPVVSYAQSLAQVIQSTFDAGGNVVIPSFAVGRTQEILYFLREISQKGWVKGYGNFSVYLDSPLAIEATNIFNANVNGYFDDDAMQLIQQGINPIKFAGLKTSISSDDSRAINFDATPKVIISASGMCEAGRIKHHLKHNLWRPESTIVFVGFQAKGTLGRALAEGASKVKLFGEEIEVKAKVMTLPGISGHADREGLLAWLGAFKVKPTQVFVIHGESSVCESFAELIKNTMGIVATPPLPEAIFDLAENRFLQAGTMRQPTAPKSTVRPISNVFARLLAAGQRMTALIAASAQAANKDIARLTDQINTLCDKWER